MNHRLHHVTTRPGAEPAGRSGTSGDTNAGHRNRERVLHGGRRAVAAALDEPSARIPPKTRGAPLALLALLAHLLVASTTGSTAPIVFPADAGVVDLTAAPYHADPTGVQDSTAAIQQALDKTPSSNKILYLPPGVYRITDTLRWGSGSHGGAAQKRQILQGAGRDLTTLKVPDAHPAFADPATARAVLWTGSAPAQRFRNAIRDLTVDTGSGNPGAIGIQFIANNQGTMRHVRIRSGDGRGVIGLDLRYTNEIGPLYIQHLHVDGFDRGIWSNWDTASLTFEHVLLENQNVYGWHNRAQKCFVRGLVSTNQVTAVYNEKDSGALFVLVEAQLAGQGAAATRDAILNQKNLYVRDLTTTGYAMAVRHQDKRRGNEPGVAGPDVEEWISHGTPTRLFDNTEASLRLPIRDAPSILWGDVASDWASPIAFGGVPDDGQDDTAAIQAAIDSGARTVYLPNGTWNLAGTLVLRGNVERFIGCEAKLAGTATIRFADGAAPAVVMERMDMIYSSIHWHHAARRTWIISSVTGGAGYTNSGRGDLFIEDVVTGPFVFSSGQRVWARQLNQETDTQIDPAHEAKVLNNGARVWILGMKTERSGTVLATRGGGVTELIGAYLLANATAKTTPAFTVDGGHVSLAGAVQQTFNNLAWPVMVAETRGGETREATTIGMLHVGYSTPLPPLETLMGVK